MSTFLYRIIRLLLYCIGLCIVFFVAMHIYISQTIDSEFLRRGITYQQSTRSLLGLNYYDLTWSNKSAERLHIPFSYPPILHIYAPKAVLSNIPQPSEQYSPTPSSLPITILVHNLQITTRLFPIALDNLSGSIYPEISLKSDTFNIEQTPNKNILMSGKISLPYFSEEVDIEVHKEDQSLFITTELPQFSFEHPLLSSHPISIPSSLLHITLQNKQIHARISTLDSNVSFNGTLSTQPFAFEGSWSSSISLSTLHTIFPLSENIHTTGFFSAEGFFAWPKGKWDIKLLPSEFQISGILFDAIELKNGTFSHTSPSTLNTHLSGPQTPNWIPYSQLGWLSLTAVAAEDASFWTHPGYSIRSIQEAIVDYQNKGTLRGGSTITQQLAKNLFLTSEKTVERKVHEFLYTLSLEQFLSKEEILTTYLNIVEFGPNIHGAKRASSLYFLKQPKSLSLVEASYLASVLPAPTRFFHIAQEAKRVSRKKTDLILTNLYDLKKISKEQLNQALRTPLVVLPPTE